MPQERKPDEQLIPPHGGYRKLKSFQMAEIVFDGTARFCKRFIRMGKSVEQMHHAARSGRQNIVEGSQASGTSKKIELKLTGIARASLQELLTDYEDFLRQNDLPQWHKDHPSARTIRSLAYAPDRSDKTYQTYIENSSPEVAANTLLCLIHQTNYLLDRQLQRLGQDFKENGGFTERMYRLRKQHRDSVR